jgi:predicted TIM-barrel fold metal-dependent hydrolase
MLAAIAASGNAARGVAALRPEAADTDLRALHAAGVRGIRLTDLSDAAAPLDALETMAARIAPLGWHAALLVEPDQLEALLPRLAGLPVPVVIDHAGRLRRCRSDLAEGERALLALAALPGCWVKISAAEYLSAAGGAFADLDGLVRRLADATPRLLWGSDWPHPSTVRTGAAVPRPEALLAALVRWFPDPAARRRLLVDNPAAVYGFR